MGSELLSVLEEIKYLFSLGNEFDSLKFNKECNIS